MTKRSRRLVSVVLIAAGAGMMIAGKKAVLRSQEPQDVSRTAFLSEAPFLFAFF